MLIYFNACVFMHSCILYILKTTPIKVHFNGHFHYMYVFNEYSKL